MYSQINHHSQRISKENDKLRPSMDGYNIFACT